MKRASLIQLLLLLLLPNGSAQEIQSEPLVFIHESYGTPEFASLLEQYEYDESISAGDTEFDRMIILKDWVFHNIGFSHNYGQGNLRNAVKILSQAKNGTPFHCSHFAAVYMQCALSLGWTTRYLFVRNTLAEEHATNEIWSNTFNKWVMVDVTWNIHIEKDGIPLSSLEIRREWIKNGGKDVTYVFGAGDDEERYTNKDFPVKRTDNNAWIWWPLDENFIAYYYEIALIGRNNFFTHEEGDGNGIWDEILIIKDELNAEDTGWPFRNRRDVDDMRALYHDLNRVDIRYSPLDRSKLTVELSAFGPYNYTPNFKEFQIRIDDGSWEPAGTAFTWILKKGKNTLSARICNRFDVVGPATTLSIHQP